MSAISRSGRRNVFLRKLSGVKFSSQTGEKQRVYADKGLYDPLYFEMLNFCFAHILLT